MISEPQVQKSNPAALRIRRFPFLLSLTSWIGLCAKKTAFDIEFPTRERERETIEKRRRKRESRERGRIFKNSKGGSEKVRERECSGRREVEKRFKR